MPQALDSENSRIAFIDIVRGILIILVVLGHTNLSNTQYFYWFHIPAFFILSGSLYKPKHIKELLQYCKKIISSLFIPYLYNFALITIAAILIGLVQMDEVSGLIKEFLKGGTHLTYIYGVFWFVSTFMISRLIFAITQTILPRYVRWPLYALSYLLAHSLAHQLPASGVTISDPWWAPRYYLLGVPYLAIGYAIRNKITHFQFIKLQYFLVTSIYAVLIYLDYNHHFLYRFDWKFGIHDSLALDLIIPAMGFYLVLGLAKLISITRQKKVFERIGQETMHIMYWHLIILAKFGI